MPKNLELIILPSFTVKKLANGQVVITKKFLDGVVQYQKLWSGSITVLMEEGHQEDNNLDQITINPDELPFALKLVSLKNLSSSGLLNEKSVVLASVEYRQNFVSQICRSLNIPCIYVSEYSLKTRKQIIATTQSNLLLRWRKQLWENDQESRQRQAIALADGLQCNGTPTYEAYHTINRNPLLFFDTRVTHDMLATDDDMKLRVHRLNQNLPLRLLFSGRLIEIKGADHLLPIAKELKHLGVQFQMYICGDGRLKPTMQHQIAQYGLSDCVKMMGVLDFKTELIPFAKHNADLFVCCHRQGDPSCTYLETMSCGVPIIGYANEAFAGIVRHAATGWPVAMEQPKLLAKQIAELNQARQAIASMSFASLNFARLHTLERTFEARISHIQKIALFSPELVGSVTN